MQSLKSLVWLPFIFVGLLCHSQCTDPPIIETICYENDQQSTISYYPTAPGVSITVSFLQGGVENNSWDDFIVYDGLVGDPVLLQNGNTDLDVSGLSVTASPDNPITFFFDGDFSQSCGDGGYPPMIFEVYCGVLPVFGCTDGSASNYDPATTVDDGTCVFINCVLDVITANYCYTNGDNTLFSYQPESPGTNILLSFSTGEIESGLFDDFIVYDGPGPGAPILYQNGLGDTDLSGLMLTSTLGNGISFEIISDFSASCADGGYSPLLWEVYCAIAPVLGCTDPSFSNYDPDATVDDGSCSDCISLSPPGCPSIDLGLDLAIPECFDPCLPITLEADVFDVGSTTSYTVEAIDFCPPYPFTVGTPIFVGSDDVFSEVVALPFDFCFYGNVFNEAVIGANGVISFDTNLAGAPCAYEFTSAIPTPSAVAGLLQGGIYNNSINGVFHDIDPSIGGDISFAVLGVAPCRTLVVNYNEVPHFSCNSLKTTQQVVLYETTNTIEIYIKDKPSCTFWNNGNAVVGLQNEDGTLGLTPPGRQTGAWTASNEAWRFNPSGASIVNVEWFQQGVGLIGSGASIQVCPSEETESFVAEARYERCDGQEVVVSDVVSVTCSMVLLPVEWLGFEAKLINDDQEVRCSWQTASELNNDYFTVQRSRNGDVWEDLAFVPGAGTSTQEHDYSFVDEAPYSGTSYYRIQQTDFDGATDYTHRAVILRSEPALFAAYPNPSSGKFILKGTDGGMLQVLDLSGRIVEELTEVQHEIDLSAKARGAYVLKYIGQNGNVSYHRIQLQ